MPLDFNALISQDDNAMLRAFERSGKLHCKLSLMSDNDPMRASVREEAQRADQLCEAYKANLLATKASLENQLSDSNAEIQLLLEKFPQFQSIRSKNDLDKLVSGAKKYNSFQEILKWTGIITGSVFAGILGLGALAGVAAALYFFQLAALLIVPLALIGAAIGLLIVASPFFLLAAFLEPKIEKKIKINEEIIESAKNHYEALNKLADAQQNLKTTQQKMTQIDETIKTLEKRKAQVAKPTVFQRFFSKFSSNQSNVESKAIPGALENEKQPLLQKEKPPGFFKKASNFFKGIFSKESKEATPARNVTIQSSKSPQRLLPAVKEKSLAALEAGSSPKQEQDFFTYPPQLEPGVTTAKKSPQFFQPVQVKEESMLYPEVPSSPFDVNNDIDYTTKPLPTYPEVPRDDEEEVNYPPLPKIPGDEDVLPPYPEIPTDKPTTKIQSGQSRSIFSPVLTTGDERVALTDCHPSRAMK